MQAKSNQQTYYCPMCEKKMKHEVAKTMGNEIHHIQCVNEDCDVWGINWDIKKLEGYEINKIARVEDLLEI